MPFQSWSSCDSTLPTFFILGLLDGLNSHTQVTLNSSCSLNPLRKFHISLPNGFLFPPSVIPWLVQARINSHLNNCLLPPLPPPIHSPHWSRSKFLLIKQKSNLVTAWLKFSSGFPWCSEWNLSVPAYFSSHCISYHTPTPTQLSSCQYWPPFSFSTTLSSLTL